MSLKKTLCHALTYDRKFLKMKICLQFIKEAGFSSLSHKGKVKLDWVSIYNFVYKENKNISTIFDSKPFKFVSKKFDPEDGVRKKAMMEFINRRLEDWFGIRIIKEYEGSKSQEYKIEVLFKYLI